MHGGCHRGMPVRTEPGTGCRLDCQHRAFVESARQLIADDQQVARLELEEARWSDLDEGEARRRNRVGVTLKSIMLDRRAQRERAVMFTEPTDEGNDR